MFENIFRKKRRKSIDPRTSSDIEIGRAGEDAAAEHLRRNGYRIAERNWRCSIGEIDLICERNDMLVFVEVKTSRIMGSLPPEIRVHENKRRKLESLARIYLKQKSDETSCRFDVVSVWWEAEETKIRHIEDAFRS